MFKYPLSLLTLPLLFYVLAINPYLAPSTYDNIIYYEGALSLFKTGKYYFFGEPIMDWPSLFSYMLAFVFRFSGTSLLACKILVLSFVFLSLFLCYNLLKLENRAFPLLSTLLLSLNTGYLIWGSRVMSDWPLLFFALLFLSLLYRLETQRSLLFAISTGIALGLALLTRYAGIALLFPLTACILQRFWINKQAQKKIVRITPELLASCIGVGIFSVFWLAPKIAYMTNGNGTPDHYTGFDQMHWIDFTALLKHLPSTLVFTTPLNSILSPVPIYIFSSLICLIYILGLRNRVKDSGWLLSDIYIFGVIASFSFSPHILPRYLLQIAPFIISDFLQGLLKALNFLKPTYRKPFFNIAIALWMTASLCLNIVWLARGNARDYNSPSPLLSQSIDQFYANYWKDIYEISMRLSKKPLNSSICLVNSFDYRYFQHYIGKKITLEAPDQNTDILILKKESSMLFNVKKYPNFKVAEETPYFYILERL